MRRAEVLEVISEHQGDLARLGVRSLAVFGSVARDEAGPDSDVDILVDLARPMGFFGLSDIKQFLEGKLGRPVDLFTPGSLKPRLRERILEEAVRAS